MPSPTKRRVSTRKPRRFGSTSHLEDTPNTPPPPPTPRYLSSSESDAISWSCRQFCVAVVPPAELSSPLGSVKRPRAVVVAPLHALIEAEREVSPVCRTVPLSCEDFKSARKEDEETFRR
ncbi:hypothetical protein FPANT_3487 [Fusarium pseudoanthophilum]|uniref:Uncharacterized protein n=1 Tax=Fusarium pseudoanthophilum TaxID=48495 RepID=A0A8H5UU70_9HYPO|nr:hypothetical protein FPANT_3487 [Fusarium pseudoanthophilum]